MNGNGARHRKKSLPTPSRNALFRSRAHFWSILGSHLCRRMASLGRLSADFRDFFVICWAPVGSNVVFLCSRVLGECTGIDLGRPGDPPGRNFGTKFGAAVSRFGRSWRPASVPTLSKFCPKFGSVCRPPLASYPQVDRTFSWRGGGRAERPKLGTLVVVMVVLTQSKV